MKHAPCPCWLFGQKAERCIQSLWAQTTSHREMHVLTIQLLSLGYFVVQSCLWYFDTKVVSGVRTLCMARARLCRTIMAWILFFFRVLGYCILVFLNSSSGLFSLYLSRCSIRLITGCFTLYSKIDLPPDLFMILFSYRYTVSYSGFAKKLVLRLFLFHSFTTETLDGTFSKDSSFFSLQDVSRGKFLACVLLVSSWGYISKRNTTTNW